MSSTALDLDLATIVGELPAMPCESLGHGTSHADVGPAEMYCRSHCPDCGTDVVKAYCALMVDYIRGNGLIRCRDCLAWWYAEAGMTILGPIHG